MVTCAALTLGLGAPSCKCGPDDEPNGSSTGGTETGTTGGGSPPCINFCANNTARTHCECTIFNGLGTRLDQYYYYTVCNAGNYNTELADLALTCAFENQQYNPTQFPPYEEYQYLSCETVPACPNEPDEPAPTTGEPSECNDWDPGADITLSQGVYSVDGGLVSAVTSNPLLVGLCDDFTATFTTSGGFVLGGLDSGELLYELGLRNGDIPRELNGMSIETFEDCLAAYYELYWTQYDTVFELEITRGNVSVTLDYEFVFSKP